jgi:hypothetical protein
VSEALVLQKSIAKYDADGALNYMIREVSYHMNYHVLKKTIEKIMEEAMESPNTFMLNL